MTLSLDNIQAIIFDLDGLLIDSEPLWQKAELGLLRQYGKAWDMEIARAHIGLRLDEAAAVMVESYQLPVSKSEFADHILSEMLKLIASEAEPMAGAEETIKRFHDLGLPLSIASSSALHYIQAVIEKFGWGNYIRQLSSAYEVENGKPDPAVYLLAAERIGIAPENCLALEDSLNGAKAARDAGMITLALPGEDFEIVDFEGVAHHIYPSLPQFLDTLS